MQTDLSAASFDYLGILKRRAPLILGIGLPIVVFTLLLAFSLPNMYASTATYDLLPDSRAAITLEREGSPDQFVYSLTERVRRSPQLRDILAEVNPYPELADQPDAALSKLRNGISVGLTSQSVLGGGGRVTEVRQGFRVIFEGPTPDAALAVASSLVGVFLQVSRSEELARVQHDIEFFASESERTRQQVAEQETRLSEFKERNFDALPEVAQANINLRGQAEREFDGVEREIRTLQQNRVFVAQQLQQAQSGPTVGNLRQLEEEYARKAAVYAPGHPDLVSLRRQIDSLRATGPVTGGNSLQAQLDTQRASLEESRQRYSDDHPDIRRALRNIEALEARIAAGEPSQRSPGETVVGVQLQTQLNAIDTQIQGLRQRAGQLRNDLAQLEVRLGSTPEVEREYQAITSGLSTARQRFDQMVGKRMDAEAAAAAIAGGAVDRFVLVNAPSMPTAPSRPARPRMVILSLIIAFVAASGAVLAAEFLDAKVRGSRDIRNLLGVTPLTVVPEIRNSAFRQRRRRLAFACVASVLVGIPVLYGAAQILAR